MSISEDLIYRVEGFHQVLQEEGYAVQDIDTAFIEYGDLVKECVGEDPEIYYEYEELVAELHNSDINDGYYDFEEDDVSFYAQYAQK